jgi:hypothetical protein
MGVSAEHCPLEAWQVPATWQRSEAGGQVTPLQLAPQAPVAGSQACPPGHDLGTSEVHSPVDLTHCPGRWHASLVGHTTPGQALHCPSARSHTEPAGHCFSGVEQRPVEGSQLPAT